MDEIHKELADLLGQEQASLTMAKVDALSDILKAEMGSFNAIRVAQGRPTLQEEMDEAIAYVREMVANGEARKEDYPELFEDECPDADETGSADQT
ncbi:hypothetical protein [Cupriavidus basilensis]|uniref:Uncharacterized protein n=1 Tax=Cupriavidus basilensis TaxID=68895 RepID=A0A0C4YE20_9BURK|nr:hypothetical protein [Cupriavidus basilensis]AJG19021.1 hypothetical protein RR42_m1624 [Cupriavidus basilensis]